MSAISLSYYSFILFGGENENKDINQNIYSYNLLNNSIIKLK